MLSSPTPFPYVGSYALIEHEGANTLARIVMRRADEVVVGLPLREGAAGNLRVSPGQLIDATPLSGEETREFHDLDRGLAGRERRNLSKAQRIRAARRDALRRRIVFAPIMERLLREVGARARIAA
jgi:hypothetical protein